jgi:hypothetical protein
MFTALSQGEVEGLAKTGDAPGPGPRSAPELSLDTRAAGALDWKNTGALKPEQRR